MPHHKLTHEENRSKVCAVCYCKSGSKASRKVSDKLEVVIKDKVFKDYDKKDTRFPSGLSSDCNFSLMVIVFRTKINKPDSYLSLIQKCMMFSCRGWPDQAWVFHVSVLSVPLPAWMVYSGRNSCLSVRGYHHNLHPLSMIDCVGSVLPQSTGDLVTVRIVVSVRDRHYRMSPRLSITLTQVLT